MEIKELNNNIKSLAKVSNSNDSFKCQKAYACLVIKELNTEIKQEVLKLSEMYNYSTDDNFGIFEFTNAKDRERMRKQNFFNMLSESSETYKKLLQKMYENRELISEYIDIILDKTPCCQPLVRFINFLDNESYYTEDFMSFVRGNLDLLEK
jgi:hypothetical protein